MNPTQLPGEFTPISPNPFIVGNPVRDRAMFFGRESEFDLVRRRFQHVDRGGIIVFCGERRSGKTSILFQILDGRLGTDFIPVLIDMQSMAIENEVDFLGRISEEIRSILEAEGRTIPPPDFASGSQPAAIFQRYIGDLRKACPDRTPILLFDEYELFENKIEGKVLSEDILNVLAGLMEHHGVCLVFTGSQALDQRRRPYWRILGKSTYKVISYLSRPDAISLMTRPVEGLVQYEDEALEAIYRLTYGQAFYTQAVCQNLVDHLNEARTRRVTLSEVRQVVAALVDNPLPQMIFLWDGMDADEKLVLALLAERLRDDRDAGGAKDLLQTMGKGGYALSLDEPRISAALEALFGKEFLHKDEGTPPRYSFRMDLWRLWIARMHSVWQVVQELGLGVPRRTSLAGRLGLPWRIAAGAVAALVLAALGYWISQNRTHAERPGGLPPANEAALFLQTEPAQATISLDGLAVGQGIYRGRLLVGQERRFQLAAAGFADSVFSVLPASRDSLNLRVALRALRGALRIETRPPGAQITVDGRPAGPSPATVAGLEAGKSHSVEATFPGRPPVKSAERVAPDSVRLVSLSLSEPTLKLRVSTEPEGAAVLLDGLSQGSSPLDLSGLTPGEHRIRARLQGYLTLDSSVVLQENSLPLVLRLRREPPGILVVQGDRPARIYIDGNLVRENVQNSGERRNAGGIHKVQVQFPSGEAVDDTVTVYSGEKVIYDYSQHRVVRRTPMGGSGS